MNGPLDIPDELQVPEEFQQQFIFLPEVKIRPFIKK